MSGTAAPRSMASSRSGKSAKDEMCTNYKAIQLLSSEKVPAVKGLLSDAPKAIEEKSLESHQIQTRVQVDNSLKPQYMPC